MANTKIKLFQKRRQRVRNKLRKTANGRMRLSVHRSNKNISVQLIDDAKGITIAAASTLEKELGVVGVNNIDAAIALDPQHYQAWTYKAMSLYFLGAKEDAITTFRKVLQPNSPR